MNQILMRDLLMKRGAEFSVDGEYRQVLCRRWDRDLASLVFILLNPSTADAYRDDATVRVCVGRAIRMGYGGIRVVNLFTRRATHPHELKLERDPVGAGADGAILREIQAAPMIIAGWGDMGTWMNRAREVTHLLCYDMGITLHALGVTAAGNPRHPLRMSYSVEPAIFMAGRPRLGR